jgi:hypothetical protein
MKSNYKLKEMVRACNYACKVIGAEWFAKHGNIPA